MPTPRLISNCALWPVVLLVGVLSSCSSPLPGSGLVIPLGSKGGYGDYTLVVYDESGLVTGGQGHEHRFVDGRFVKATPDQRQLDVAWIGTACAHHPTLKVTGDPTALHLVLSDPDDPQWPGVGCPAVGIPLAATLRLKEAVLQESVSFESGE